MSMLPFPNLWDDYSLRSYLGEIRRRHGIIETLAMPSMHDLPPSRIETLFVSPLLAEGSVNAESDPATWPSGLGLFQALEAYPRLVVLGDPGGGKTTLSNWLAWRLSAGLTSPLPQVLTERVPIPCVLRDMTSDLFTDAPKIEDLAVKIAQYLLGEAADAALLSSLQARVAAGQYVLILDGVDEIAVTHRKVIAMWMQQAHRQDACVLATSRIVGYEDAVIHQTPSIYFACVGMTSITEEEWECHVDSLPSGERAKLLGLESENWACLRYLLPFDQQRIAAFAENWYRQRCGTEQEAQQKTRDLLASIAQSPTTQQLARTPNLLSMMAIVHRERAHLPDGKALLYEEIANAYINTIDSQRKILPNDALAPYPWKARKGWLAYIAFQMQLRRDGSEKDAGVLVAEQDVLTWLGEAMRHSGVVQPEATAQEYLRWVARRSGLLLPRGADRYAFVHLSFQEYFCACHLATRIVSPAFVRDKLKPDEPVTKTALAKWGMFSLWRETLVNLFELLSAEQDSDWIDDLTGIVFGEFEKKIQFGKSFLDERSDLAARLILDRHVRLSDAWQDRLASRCCSDALYDWQSDLVWQVVVKLGYAAELDEHFVPTAKLRTVVVQQAEWADLTPLAHCPALQYCRLSETAVSDLSPLAGLSQLQELSISGAAISDLYPLAGLNNLQVLSLNSTSVSDLRPLARLDKLKHLSLNKTKVFDLHPLAGLSSLQMLILDKTGVSDLRPLADLVDLKYLTIPDTGITDVSALAHLKNLKILGFPKSSAAEISVS